MIEILASLLLGFIGALAMVLTGLKIGFYRGSLIVFCICVILYFLIEMKSEYSGRGGDRQIQRSIEQEYRGLWLKWGLDLFLILAGLCAIASALGRACALWAVLAGTLMLSRLADFGLRCRFGRRLISRFRVSRNNFPRLYALAEEVRAQMNCTRPFCIVMASGNLSVSSRARRDVLMVEPLYLRTLNRQELRQCLIHEFAHLADGEVRKLNRWLRVSQYLQDRGGFSWSRRACLRFCAQLNHERMRTMPKLELEADAWCARDGHAAEAVSALAKAEICEKFKNEDWTSAYWMFEPKKFCMEKGKIQREAFRRMFSERKEDWIHETESRREMEGDLHPTFSQRRKVLGIDAWELLPSDAEPDWHEEMEALCDAQWALSRRNYAASRSRYYVQRKKKIDQLESAENPLETWSADALLDAALACSGIDPPRAMEINRAVLAREPQNHRAMLQLGILLAINRDEAAFEMLYKAAEDEKLAAKAMEIAGMCASESGSEMRFREYCAKAKK